MLCLAIISAAVLLMPANAAAIYLETPVSTDIPGDDYWHIKFALTEGDPISISLSVTGGLANFYFMDREGFILFNNAWNGTSQFDLFTYYPDLSAESAASISKSAAIPETGTYYIAAYCTGISDLHITGTISYGVKPTDATNLIIPIMMVAVIFGVPISVYVLRDRSKKRKRQQMIQSGAMPRCPQCGGYYEPGFSVCPSCGFRLR